MKKVDLEEVTSMFETDMAAEWIRLFVLTIGPIRFGFAVNAENFEAISICNKQTPTSNKKTCYPQKSYFDFSQFHNGFCFHQFCSLVSSQSGKNTCCFRKTYQSENCWPQCFQWTSEMFRKIFKSEISST